MLYRLPYPLSVGTVRAGDWASTVPDLLVAEGRVGVALGEDPADARAALERTALLDPLTDAYNRRGFQLAAGQQAERADRTGERCLVFYADLVGLKAANDAHGDL